MSIWDIILTIVYFPLCLFIGRQIKNKHWKNPLYQKWFMKGLAIKLFGALAFCLVYTYYFDYGGDTRGYFHDATIVVQSLEGGFGDFWDVLHRSTLNVSAEALDCVYRITYYARMEYYTVNLAVPFYILGFGNFFATSLVIALFSYWGIWHFFLLFIEKYPKIEKQLAFAVLFVPSVWFWGSIE